MPGSAVNEVVKALKPVGLYMLDPVRLMNRIDTKFILSAGRLPDLLSGIKSHYAVLEINENRILSYLTSYLDTGEYLFFRQHVTDRPERHKVRYRTYESTGTTFLEVKKRTNKNRTIKWRTENRLTPGNTCDEIACRFISDYVPGKALHLRPVLTNCFKRITLAEKGFSERATIDYDLSFSDIYGNQVRYPYVAIVEIKREGYSFRSPLMDILKDLSVHPAGFSKYCFGASVLYDIPGRNILKEKQLLIKRIENEYLRCCST
jgi:hypothetical protein